MVDRVLDGYIREFATDFDFANTPTALQFETFVNYLLVKRSYSGILDPEQLSTGEAAGIDGIAIFVNDRLVTSPEDVDFFEHAHVRLRFLFVQSKTTLTWETWANSSTPSRIFSGAPHSYLYMKECLSIGSSNSTFSIL